MQKATYREGSNLQVYVKTAFPLSGEMFFLQACYLILQWKSLFLLKDCYGSECKPGAPEEGYQKVLFPFSHTT